MKARGLLVMTAGGSCYSLLVTYGYLGACFTCVRESVITYK